MLPFDRTSIQRIDLRAGAWMDYAPGWLSPERAHALLEAMLERDDWEQVHIHAVGKDVPQPRLTAWASELPYKYSGQTLEPRPWDPVLAELNEAVSEVATSRVEAREPLGEVRGPEHGGRFNHVLLNLYRDGSDRIGLHADNEPELGKDPLIAAVSLGAERRFELAPKHRKSRRIRHKLVLEHGSLLIMGGTMQHRWRHQIPRQGSVTEPRVNLTFRTLLGPPGWRSWEQGGD